MYDDTGIKKPVNDVEDDVMERKDDTATMKDDMDITEKDGVDMEMKEKEEVTA